MTLVNPDEGEVAIARPTAPDDVMVARLSNRALRWIEEATGVKAADLWDMAFAPPLSATITTTVLWAGLEDQRRRSPQPAKPWTIDDVDELVDATGLEYAQNRAVVLIFLAFKGPLAKISTRAAAAGKPDPVVPLKAAAQVGTGMPTLPPPSEPDSPSTSTGA